jgi:hypothetical protein
MKEFIQEFRKKYIIKDLEEILTEKNKKELIRISKSNFNFSNCFEWDKKLPFKNKVVNFKLTFSRGRINLRVF